MPNCWKKNPSQTGEKIPTAEAYIKHGMTQHQTRLIFEIQYPPEKIQGQGAGTWPGIS